MPTLKELQDEFDTYSVETFVDNWHASVSGETAPPLNWENARISLIDMIKHLMKLARDGKYNHLLD